MRRKRYSMATDFSGSQAHSALRAAPSQYVKGSALSLHQALREMQRQRRLIRQTLALVLLAGEPGSEGEGWITGDQAQELFRYLRDLVLDWEGYVVGEGMSDPAGIYLFFRGNAYRAFDVKPDPERPRLEGGLDREACRQAEQATREYYEELHQSVILGPQGWDYSDEEREGIKYNEDGYLVVGNTYSTIERYDATEQVWTVATAPYVGPNLDMPPQRYTVSLSPEPEKWIVTLQSEPGPAQ